MNLKDVKVLSLHRKKREVAVATPLFDERWPWAKNWRPKALCEPDQRKFYNVLEIDRACDWWLSNRGLKNSWRRWF